MHCSLQEPQRLEVHPLSGLGTSLSHLFPEPPEQHKDPTALFQGSSEQGGIVWTRRGVFRSGLASISGAVRLQLPAVVGDVSLGRDPGQLRASPGHQPGRRTAWVSSTLTPARGTDAPHVVVRKTHGVPSPVSGSEKVHGSDRNQTYR